MPMDLATRLTPETPVRKARGRKLSDEMRIEDYRTLSAVKRPDTRLLFYAPDMEDVAHEIEEMSEGLVILGKIDWKRFADGFPNVLVHHSEHIKWTNVSFLASFHSPTAIFEQISLIFSLPRFLAREVKLILPYFPTGTMERVTAQGQVITAATLARLISSVPLTRGGPVQLTIFDIHTLQNQFYFGDNVLTWLKSCVHLLKHNLEELEKHEQIAIAFPDEGAFKRFASKFAKYETIICDKVRDGNTRVVKVKEGNPSDRHVIIVDDLVQTGGTLIKCAEVLRRAGASKVSCYVTHAIFPKESWRKFTKEGDSGGLFDTFYITNSVPRMAKTLADVKPFKVLSIAPIVASMLLHRTVDKLNADLCD